MCTRVSPHQSVPTSAAQRPSPGLCTSHLKQTSDRTRQSTREQGRRVSNWGGPSFSWQLHNAVSSGTKCTRLTGSVCGFQLCGATGHFRQWEKRDNWSLYNTCSCMRPICRRLISVENFSGIMEISLAELVVLKSHFLRLIIMTDRDIYYELMTSLFYLY